MLTPQDGGPRLPSAQVDVPDVEDVDGLDFDLAQLLAVCHGPGRASCMYRVFEVAMKLLNRAGAPTSFKTQRRRHA